MRRELPLDSDLEAAESRAGRARPVHLRWRFIGLVAVGGAVGTAARELLSMTIPSIGEFPIATAGINVVGALLLGMLLEALTTGGSDQGVRRNLRLLVGTGFFGGFTTYSTLATDTGVLVGHGSIGPALAYAFGTLLLGAVATWLGIALASWVRRRRGGSSTSEGIAG